MKVKAEEQNRLLDWERARGGHTYAQALSEIEQMVTARRSLRFRSWMLDEALLRSRDGRPRQDLQDLYARDVRGHDAAGGAGGRDRAEPD